MFIAVLATAGCATSVPEAPGAWGRAGVGGQTAVEVKNDNWADMRVYAYAAGRKHRLGVVTGLTSARFTLPDDMASSGSRLRFLLDPIGGGRGHTTEPVMVTPGTTVDLHVMNQIALTSAAIYR